MKRNQIFVSAIMFVVMLMACASCRKESENDGNGIEPQEVVIPEGAIDGLFTINANGEQVYFSKGNLQYQAGSNTWRFAENQWDYAGKSNINISSVYNDWIDLFGWGTSGYGHGAICFQPWSISEDEGSYYAYGSAACNLNEESGKADWGFNRIANGGNQEGQWRTLTGGDNGEWKYLLENRTTQSGIRFAKAQVNGINGLILFPDDWNGSSCNLNDFNNPEASYGSNVIAESEWSSVFSDSGCVFLPAAGSRYAGASVGFSGDLGVYWSSSYADEYNACYMSFNDTYLFPNHIYYRYYGFSVRLVQPFVVAGKSESFSTSQTKLGSKPFWMA